MKRGRPSNETLIKRAVEAAMHDAMSAQRERESFEAQANALRSKKKREAEEYDADDDFEAALKNSFTSAKLYNDQVLTPARVDAQLLYDGFPIADGDDTDDQKSDVVATVIRDTIRAMLPSLIRVLVDADQPITYHPRTEQDIPLAKQASDFINQIVLQQDNDFFRILHDALHDALLMNAGIVHWYAEEITHSDPEHWPDVDPAMVASRIANDPELEIVSGSVELHAPSDDPGYLSTVLNELPGIFTGEIDPETLRVITQTDGDLKVSLWVRRTCCQTYVRLRACKPEMFLVDPKATSLEDAAYVAHMELKTVSELVEMGFDEDEILEEAEPYTDIIGTSAWQLEQARRRTLSYIGDDRSDDAARRVLYVEHYIRYDSDDDGVAELHRVRTVGDCYILSAEMVQDIPYAIFSCSPRPHQVFGNSYSDLLMDLQNIASNVLRDVLDSLKKSVYKQRVWGRGVNLDDVLNSSDNIRADDVNQVRELDASFVGEQALPVLKLLDDIRAQRTGISAATQGLDPAVLQSATGSAVQATISAAQESLELTARFLANGLKTMARGLLRTFVRHANAEKPRIVRLTNTFVPVYPASWDAEMGLSIEIGASEAQRQQKIAVLANVIAKQEAVMQQYGPLNPIVTPAHWQNAVYDFLKESKIKDPSRYFATVTPETMQQIAQAIQSKPDPNTMLANIEIEKTRAMIDATNSKRVLDWQKAKLEDDRDRDESDRAFALKAAEIKARYNAQVDTAAIQAEVERDRQAMDAMSSLAQGVAAATDPQPPAMPS